MRNTSESTVWFTKSDYNKATVWRLSLCVYAHTHVYNIITIFLAHFPSCSHNIDETAPFSISCHLTVCISDNQTYPVYLYGYLHLSFSLFLYPVSIFLCVCCIHHTEDQSPLLRFFKNKTTRVNRTFNYFCLPFLIHKHLYFYMEK